MKLSPRVSGCLLPLLVVLAATVTMAQSAGFGFVWDDLSLLFGWQEIQNPGAHWQELLSGQLPYHHRGLYRPVRSLFYALSYQLYGTNASLYHLQAIAIHAMTTLGVYALLSQLLAILKLTTKKSYPGSLALVVALLFAIHPIHVESIAWITASFDTLGILFAIWGLYLYLRAREGSKLWLGLSVVLLILAALTNEITYVTLMVVVLFEWLVFKRSRLQIATKIPVWMVGVAISLVALIRFELLEIGARSGLVLSSRLVTFVVVVSGLARGFLLNLWPFAQTTNHHLVGEIWSFHHQELWPEGVISPPSVMDPVFVLSLGLVVGLVYLAWKWRGSQPLASLAIGWYFVWMMPLMQFVPQSSLFREMYLYAASLGPILLVALGWHWACSRFGYTRPSLMLLILALGWVVKTQTYLPIWKTNYSLWTHASATNPDSVYSRSDLARHLFEQGDVDEAETILTEAVRLNPQYVPATTNLAAIYIHQQRYSEAIELLTYVIEIAPNYYQAFEKLAAAYMNQGQFLEAAAWFEKVLQYEPNNPAIYRHLGRAYQGAWVLSEAIRYYQASLERQFSLEVLIYLADSYFDSALNSEATKTYRQVLEHDPSNQHALSQLELLRQ